jgi:hypothetical protein
MKTIDDVVEFIEAHIKDCAHVINVNKEAGYQDTVSHYQFRKSLYENILDFINGDKNEKSY